MIELLVLFLGIYGALAAPQKPRVNHDLHYHTDSDAVVIDAQPIGTENLNEKALPISHLSVMETNNLSANNNLAEKSQIPQRLPGTGNLAEKRIPEIVLQKLSHPPRDTN